ncbi:hypothetical protein [Endozoicomonas sp. 8E]|uniref:hypothetical protein n=1 Tax=Endozoicomonas sp. 8E TaxID=3035692 RepID=UPI0029391AD9|nr:hypothetical protein [Endozoicomonas sp. 8E]WOG30333.1 hypothetical protein P6910_12015 [Endozoicomonas sp. 8E]
MISHSITELPKTTKSSVFSYRTKTNQLVAGFLGIIMTSPCMTLLAANPLLTSVDERFFEGKGTKESDFLSDLINHNALTGRFHLVTPNDTNLIFAMNTGNELDVNESQVQEQPQGAEAAQMQPLMNLSLPPMSREQIAEIIRKLNPGLSEDTLNTLLNNIPEMPPADNLTIASMIEQVKSSLRVDVNQNQNAIIGALSHIQATESPVNPNNSQQQMSHTYLLLAYYAAINSSGASMRRAHVFFNSFLLHAANIAGISILHRQKIKLLGGNKPIKDKDVLKVNIAKSYPLFYVLTSLEKERFRFLQYKDLFEDPFEDPFEDRSVELVDIILSDATKLLNHEIDRNELSMCKPHITSAEQMLDLIEEFGEDEPELVAWNNQFLSLIDLIGLMLDPFASENADLLEKIDNIDSYFKKSDKRTTFISHASGKSRELLKEIKKVIVDATFDQENQSHKSFKIVIQYLKSYLARQLHVTFTNKKHHQVIVETLTTGFRSLHEQSYQLWLRLSVTINDISEQAGEAGYNEAAKGEDLGRIERKKKYLQKRLKYLNEFVQWLDWFFGSRTCVPDYTYSSESERSDTDLSDSRSYSDGSESEKD